MILRLRNFARKIICACSRIRTDGNILSPRCNSDLTTDDKGLYVMSEYRGRRCYAEPSDYLLVGHKWRIDVDRDLADLFKLPEYIVQAYVYGIYGECRINRNVRPYELSAYGLGTFVAEKHFGYIGPVFIDNELKDILKPL